MAGSTQKKIQYQDNLLLSYVFVFLFGPSKRVFFQKTVMAESMADLHPVLWDFNLSEINH